MTTIGPNVRDKHHTGEEPAEFLETPMLAPSAYPHDDPDDAGDCPDEPVVR
jgi:hypothetical protein